MLTSLSYALLGLIGQAPRSGYELMNLFRTTPLGRYSGSPGAIYPALKVLETSRLIHGVVKRPSTLRPKRMYRLTAQGRLALRRWLQQPMTIDDAAFREPELTLRFALMEGVLDDKAIERFLKDFSAICDEYAASIEGHLKKPGMTLHGRLALQGGIDAYRARAEWAKRAIRRVRAEHSRDGSRSDKQRKGQRSP